MIQILLSLERISVSGTTFVEELANLPRQAISKWDFDYIIIIGV